MNSFLLGLCIFINTNSNLLQYNSVVYLQCCIWLCKCLWIRINSVHTSVDSALKILMHHYQGIVHSLSLHWEGSAWDHWRNCQIMLVHKLFLIDAIYVMTLFSATLSMSCCAYALPSEVPSLKQIFILPPWLNALTNSSLCFLCPTSALFCLWITQHFRNFSDNFHFTFIIITRAKGFPCSLGIIFLEH